MWDIAGLIFSFIFGLLGLGVAGYQIVTGRVIHSIDNIFLTLVGLLLAVVLLGYVAWRLQAALAQGTNRKKGR